MPNSKPFTTTIDVQISYYSAVVWVFDYFTQSNYGLVMAARIPIIAITIIISMSVKPFPWFLLNFCNMLLPFFTFGIACQDNRYNHLNFNAIYRISYKIAKNSSPSKIDLRLLISENTIFLKLCLVFINCGYGQFNPKELGCMKSRVLVFSSQIFERSIKRISYQNHFPRQEW